MQCFITVLLKIKSTLDKYRINRNNNLRHSIDVAKISAYEIKIGTLNAL